MEKSVLNIIVSKYNHYSGKHPIDCNLMEYLNDYSLEAYVLKIRSKDSKAERDELKEKLPGITPSAVCNPSRSEKNVVRRTGLMSFDIDKVDSGQMETVRNIIIKIPYVAYCGLSASGRGYWGLVPITNPAKHDQHFEALQRYFKELGIDRPNFDTAVKDIARFRYYSVDRDAYFNHKSEVFPYTFQKPVQSKMPYKPKPGHGGDLNPFDAFNKCGDIESLLLAHGWTYQPIHDKGTRRRYSRPGKESGVSADYCTERKILYVFSSDPTTGIAVPDKGYNHVQVFCQLECNNDFKLCAKKLKNLGYGKH